MLDNYSMPDSFYEMPPVFFYACPNCDWCSEEAQTKMHAIMREPSCCPECGCEELFLDQA